MRIACYIACGLANQIVLSLDRRELFPLLWLFEFSGSCSCRATTSNTTFTFAYDGADMSNLFMGGNLSEFWQENGISQSFPPRSQLPLYVPLTRLTKFKCSLEFCQRIIRAGITQRRDGSVSRAPKL